MFLDPKLLLAGLAGFIGIGGVGSAIVLAETAQDGPNTWRVKSSKASFTVLVCQAEKGPKILVSMELKDESKEEILLKAFTENGKAIEEDNVLSLYFWENGTSKLGEIGGDHNYKYGGENIPCTKNVFIAVKEKNAFSTAKIKWESSLKSIKLSLDPEGCKSNKECSIKIEDGVGLQWKDEFKPRVVFK